MKRILLLGANGQVGFELRRALAPLGHVVCATRSGRLGAVACEQMDLADPASLASALDQIAADVIVNAAAYTAVDRAEDEPDLAACINAEAVAALGQWAAAQDAAVLHYSTDYVFSGVGATPWSEQDDTEPLGVYGRSKLGGEVSLAASGCRHLILRTAWVYAARGHNFLLSMLRLAAERDELRVVSDQHGTPTPACLIAAASSVALARWLEMPTDQQREHSGVYHLACQGVCSWHVFAEAIVERAHAEGVLARCVPVTPIDTADYPTRAQRPAWSVLDCGRLEATFGLRLPGWQQGLDLVLADLVAAGYGTRRH